MSAVGQWRIELQALPEYEQGYLAGKRYERRSESWRLKDAARYAWELGWDDALDDSMDRERGS